MLPGKLSKRRTLSPTATTPRSGLQWQGRNPHCRRLSYTPDESLSGIFVAVAARLVPDLLIRRLKGGAPCIKLPQPKKGCKEKTVRKSVFSHRNSKKFFKTADMWYLADLYIQYIVLYFYKTQYVVVYVKKMSWPLGVSSL